MRQSIGSLFHQGVLLYLNRILVKVKLGVFFWEGNYGALVDRVVYGNWFVVLSP